MPNHSQTSPQVQRSKSDSLRTSCSLYSRLRQGGAALIFLIYGVVGANSSECPLHFAGLSERVIASDFCLLTEASSMQRGAVKNIAISKPSVEKQESLSCVHGCHGGSRNDDSCRPQISARSNEFRQIFCGSIVTISEAIFKGSK